jgi:CubicO group peptidase (beta-lactamase class C family)
LLDLVQKYCPAFPQKPWPITTRELLGHLAGIRYYHVPETPYSASQSDPEVGNTCHFENGIETGLKFFADDPLVALPGTQFNYSTQGYTLVGCAIEGASGEKYMDYVRDHVLVPAGMPQTRPDDRFAIIPLRARFYSKDKSTKYPAGAGFRQHPTWRDSRWRSSLIVRSSVPPETSCGHGKCRRMGSDGWSTGLGGKPEQRKAWEMWATADRSKEPAR